MTIKNMLWINLCAKRDTLLFNRENTYQQHAVVLAFFLVLPWILWHDFYHQAMIMGDNWRAAYPAYQLTIEKVLHGSSLLWNEFSLAGHPFIAEIVNGVLYPPKLLLYLILPVPLAYNATILVHLSLTGFFTYLYLGQIGIRKRVALLGGAILMLSPIYLIQELDSISLLHTITWFPLIIYFIEVRITTGQKKWLLFAALTFVLQLFAGFTQDSFYTAFAIVIYAAMRYSAVLHSFSAGLRIFSYDMILFALIVISFSAIQLFPTQELLFYAQHYQQSWDLISLTSAPPLGLLGFFHPFLWGGFANGHGIQTNYFLPSFISNPYMGMLTILFALYALTYWRNNIIQIWLILLTSTLLIAAGVHIMPIAKMLYAFPLTHAFRFPTRMYFISSMAIVVLFAYAFDRFLEADKKRIRSAAIHILTVGGIINLTVCMLICGMIIGIDFFHGFADKLSHQTINNQPLQDFFQYYRWDNIALFIPLMIFVVDAILLWLLVATHAKYQLFLVLGLGSICLFEVSLVSSHFFINHHVQYTHSDLILKLKAKLNPTERISVSEEYAATLEAPRFADSAGIKYQLPTLDGFVSFDERQIASLQPGISSLADLGYPSFFVKVLQHKNDFLSMLGMKYAVLPSKFNPAITPLPYYKKVFTLGEYIVYENLNAMPRLYSLNDIRFEKNTDYARIDLTKTAVLNYPIDHFSGLGIADILRTRYQAGNIKAKVSCSTKHCFVILSESYFPGWKALVDGKKQRLYKVNDLIMGTMVEKGEHTLKFHYFPDSFALGLLLFIAGLIWVPIWLKG